MSALQTTAARPPAPFGAASDDPEVLMDQIWRLVERIGEVATDPDLYHVDLIKEGLQRGDLNLIEVGLHRFRDVEPLGDEDD